MLVGCAFMDLLGNELDLVGRVEADLYQLRAVVLVVPTVNDEVCKVCGTSAKWDGFGNREIRLVSAASTGDNQAETSRPTNIASGTGYGGRSEQLKATETGHELGNSMLWQFLVLTLSSEYKSRFQLN